MLNMTRLQCSAAAFVWIVACAVGASRPSIARAVPLSGALGCDSYNGVGNHQARGVSATLEAGLGSRTAGIVAAGLYDDNLVGKGQSYTAGASVHVRGPLRMRGLGSHIRGENGLRAMRYEIGPQFTLAQGRNVGLRFVHYGDNSMTSNGMRTEVDGPIATGLTARFSGAYASTSAGVAAIEGSVGLVWSAMNHLEVAGDVGIAQNGSGAPGRPWTSSGDLEDFPLFGAPPEEGDVSPTLLLGVRLLIP